MMISLRAGAKVYLNGAVVRADRKVNLELLNDVTFLLDSHVLQAEDATTPLRQLYFVLQTLIMDPSGGAAARAMLPGMIERLSATAGCDPIRTGLAQVSEQVGRARLFEALRTVRSLYPVEAAILNPAAGRTDAAPAGAAAA